MHLYKTFDWTVDEPFREGCKTDLTNEELSIIRSDVKISSKFNKYLMGKSVIVVGPSPYLQGLGRGASIDKYDIVVRLNKAWQPTKELEKDYGQKTNIRYHCMMEHENNGGQYVIDSMVAHGVEWLASQFPYNLSYFHNDNKNFDKQNNKRINFHVPSDLIYHLNTHISMETRSNVATSAILDLINYDVKTLHLTGISFFQDGWVGDYKAGSTNNEKSGKYNGMINMQKEGHSQEPQMHIIKLLCQTENKFTLDNEIHELLK